MLGKTLTIVPLALLLLFLGSGNPALSLEASDGGLTEGDQDAFFGDGSDSFSDVEDFEVAGDTDIDEDEAAPDVVRAGGIIGIWQYTAKHEGWFRGKLYVKVKGKRVLIGRVKGKFKHFVATGKREMVGVVLNRDGKYRGTLKGEYNRHGFSVRWSTGGGKHKGKAKAKFVAPFGRAGFLGKFWVKKDVFTDDSAED